MIRVDQFKPVHSGCTAALVALVFTLLCPLDLRAQADSQGEFYLAISEKEQRLASDDPSMIHYLEKDLGFQRMISRNTPFLELQNDENSESPIVQFRLTIGDTRFHFGDEFLGLFALLGDTTPGFEIESTVGSDGDELIVNILNGGLLPGDLLRFRIDLDVDAAYASTYPEFPDYRTVLFDINGTAVYGVQASVLGDDNAMASVTFKQGDLLLQTTPVAFIDALRTEATIINDSTRGCGTGPDLLDVPFGVTGALGTVPEPSSIALSLVALVGGAAVCRRYRARG